MPLDIAAMTTSALFAITAGCRHIFQPAITCGRASGERHCHFRATGHPLAARFQRAFRPPPLSAGYAKMQDRWQARARNAVAPLFSLAQRAEPSALAPRAGAACAAPLPYFYATYDGADAMIDAAPPPPCCAQHTADVMHFTLAFHMP